MTDAQKAWELIVGFERTFISDKPGRIKRRDAILYADAIVQRAGDVEGVEKHLKYHWGRSISEGYHGSIAIGLSAFLKGEG